MVLVKEKNGLVVSREKIDIQHKIFALEQSYVILFRNQKNVIAIHIDCRKFVGITYECIKILLGTSKIT